MWKTKASILKEQCNVQCAMHLYLDINYNIFIRAYIQLSVCKTAALSIPINLSNFLSKHGEHSQTVVLAL